jgi:two-component system chemotaxis sensor kinase CheA
LNAFIEQFLIEGRELIEQAVSDLLALETHPGNATHLDGVFRAVHTLKGAAGIVDFAAMARGLHAAEDALSAARSGADPLTPALIGDCLSVLDQVQRWLAAIEASEGELPGDAEAEADAMVARFVREPDAADAPVADDGSAAPWHDLLRSSGAARVAIRYRPRRDCFLQGDDPLALLQRVPELTALRLVPSEPWPDPEAFDPFACQLTFLALSASTSETVSAILLPVIDQVEIVELDRSSPDLSALCRNILEAQHLMLDVAEPRGLPGHFASASRVVANVLRHIGRPAGVDEISQGLAGLPAGGDPTPLIATIRTILAGTATAARLDPVADAAPDPADNASPAREVAARALRVDVERIDTLVRLAGELAVIKGAIGLLCRLPETGADPDELLAGLKDQHGQLDRLATDLQHAVLRIRVLPLRDIFQRFRRVVRDLGSSLGKSIQLVTEGDDTEADKEIVESLFEPLLHVLRNAADHGLEDGEQRVSLGKPRLGTIWLRASRSGEQVIVEIEDDGRGIDMERIRVLAAQRGIANTAALSMMSDAEVVELIFAPGFSTAAQVTNVSGRGVGMDAVRTAVGRLGGWVGVESKAGRGTTVRFVLPFTLLITRVVTVEAGGQVFGIPLDSVIETVRIGQGQITSVGATQAFSLRNRVVPLFDLAEVVGIARGQPCFDEVAVVVIQMEGERAGLVVEKLGQRIDAMLKPMDGLLSGTAGIAGTTLLGDGRVLIVLDVQELLR